MSEFVTIAKKEEVPNGGGVLKTTQSGQRIAIFNVDGKYHALDDACVHMGGSLSGGEVAEGRVTCPLHGWQFEVATGQNCMGMGEGVAVKTYTLRVEGDDILVEL